jgi:hypothetical protein
MMDEKQSPKADKIKVYCAVPTVGTVADSQSYFWRSAEKKYGDRIEFVWPELCVRRIFHDFARNSMVDDFLATDCPVIFFLDSDVVPPPDVFDIVLEHEKWMVAGAPYPIFVTPPGHTEPQIVFTAYKGKGKNGGLGAADVPKEGIEFIDGLATGCLFIKRELFSQLEKPYFAFEFDSGTRAMKAGEDLSFCRKVTDLGHKFYVDYSKVCRHYKHVCLLEVNNYSLTYAKKSVETYASLIKPALDAMSERIRSKAKSAIVAPSTAAQRIIQSFRT